MRRTLDSNLSGNEVYRTNSSILLVRKMLCSKFHRQTGFYTQLVSQVRVSFRDQFDSPSRRESGPS